MLSFSIPSPRSQVVDENGIISKEWYLFLSAILQTIGGNNPVVSGGFGISATENQMLFEEFPITSIEGHQALVNVEELRADMQIPQISIKELQTALEELKADLQLPQPSIKTIQTSIDELSALIYSLPNYDVLRTRIEQLEDRLA